MPDLDAVRRFAGAEGSGENPALQMCLSAATAWFEGAGVPPETEGDDYDFWVANLAAWMYDNRGNADMNAAIPPYIETCVHQLRYVATKQLNLSLRAKLAELGESADAETLAAINRALKSLDNDVKAECLRALTAEEDTDEDPTGAAAAGTETAGTETGAAGGSQEAGDG